jgi:Bacterial Ig-like domain (group 3)/Pro-kumamolisin, activation domain
MQQPILFAVSASAPGSPSSRGLGWRRFILLALAGVAALAMLFNPDAALAQSHTPAKVLNGEAAYVKHYDPAKMLRLAIALKPPHMAEERQFLEDVQNKNSPLFHQFLSDADWIARFAPAAADEQAVVDWAQSQGLTLTQRFPNRLVVDVEAPAGTIEKALGVVINNYEVGPDLLYSNDRDPVLPAALITVVDSVLGLNSIEHLRPASARGPYVPAPDYVPGPPYKLGESARKDADPDAPAVTAGVPAPQSGYWTPKDMYSSAAYDYQALMNQGHCCNPNNNPDNSPPESSIAIAGFGDVSLTDVSDFQSYFNYLSYNVQKIPVDGGYTCGNNDDNCGEVTMDTEWSLAMANSGSTAGTAKVWVYEGPNFTSQSVVDVLTHMVNDGHARVMSMSFGLPEASGDSAVDSVLSEMAGKGWTMVIASGDEGAAGGCGDKLGVLFPASDPNVTAVGGTTLNESSGPTYEVAWTGSDSSGSCSSNHGGSTGGFSSEWPVPSYQSSFIKGNRVVPDVALEATFGHDVFFNGGWIHQGGTSVATPMFAGFFAQENAYLLSIGNKCGSSGTSACAPLGNANYPLYEEGLKNNAGRSPFYDIVSGCNSNDITVEFKLTAYCASKGYDLVTGWGSANMLQLAWAINWEVTAATGIPSISFSGPAINTWYNSNQTVKWTVVDYNGGGKAPGTGIAGETQGWDSIPADPKVETHGGSGNSFYSGPQFPNGATGCLAFVANGCSGDPGLTQGCHTVHVEGWNNQGLSTGDSTYGPLCYDTVPPTVSASLSPAPNAHGWNNQPVTVTLTANDPGGSGASGIKETAYAFGVSNCGPNTITLCVGYNSPVAVKQQGAYVIKYLAEDKAGNFSSVNTVEVNFDDTPPVTTSALSGTLYNEGVYIGAVTFTLKATDNLSGVLNTTWTLDGVGTGPFSVSTLGAHTLKYYSTDFAGNSENTHTISFTIVAPTTTTIVSFQNPSIPGQPVTLTATVTATEGGPVSGTVTFMDGATALGAATIIGGNATFTTSALVLGSHSLTAVYHGSAGDGPSTSASLSQTVAQTLSLNFSPQIVVFPVTPIGTRASTLVQVYNFGSAGVTFTGASITGPQASEFAVETNGCASLAAGPSGPCYINVGFTPAGAGARIAGLLLKSSSGGPWALPLAGTGEAATQTVTVSPAAFDFGVNNIAVKSADSYFTVQNLGTVPTAFSGVSITGANASDFSITTNSCPASGSSLAPLAVCYVYVVFTPGAAGLRSASLSINDSATGSPQTASLYGVGQTEVGQISFSQGAMDLGIETLNVKSGAAYVQVENTGTTNVTFSSIAIGGVDPADFSISSNTCSGALAPTGFCYVYVVFKPTAAGLRTAALSFTDIAAGSPQAVSLEGEGVTATQTLAFSYLDYAFGDYTVGVPSAQHYFQVYNAGDSPAAFAGVTITGANPADFAITSNSCPTAGASLAPAASCYVYVYFTPSAAGLRSAALTFTDAATGSPQSIGLAGVGLTATQSISFSVPAVVFPGTTVGASTGESTVNVYNEGTRAVTFSGVAITGPQAGDFSIMANTCSSPVNPGSGCDVQVSFRPPAKGIASAFLQFTDTATGSPQNLPLAGDGEPASPPLSLNPTLLNFGSVNVGSTTPASSVSVSAGGEASTQSIVGPNAADFSITANTCTGVIASCGVSVDFHPSGLGARLAALEFNTGGVLQDVLLAGVASTASTVLASPSSLDFGLLNVGATGSPESVQILNTGGAPVTFSGLSITGANAADFTLITDSCADLAFAQACSISLLFSPGAAGPRTATLYIADSATGSPQAVTLTGLGQPAGASLSLPPALDLGSAVKGVPVSATFSPMNTGTAAVTFTRVSVSGANAADFVIAQNSCVQVIAFGSCSIQVSFNPGAAGARTANLVFADNATGSPQTVVLNGVGILPAATLVLPPALAFPATVVNSGSNLIATVLNVGTVNVAISSAAISGSNAADFSISNNPCGQVAAHASCGIQILFMPGGAGARTASLTLTSNSPGSPQSIALTGVGQAGSATLFMPPEVAFPSTAQGTTSLVSFAVDNIGNQPVGISSLALGGANAQNFTVRQWCPLIAVGASCSVQVSYTPSASEIGASATLTFTDNAAGSPQTVQLTASAPGAVATISLGSSALTFPAQTVGTVSGVQTLYIYNTGTTTVMIAEVAITGADPNDFLVTANTCQGGMALAGGGNCYVQIAFAPAATGARTATIRITDSALGGAQSATLSGTGH